MQPYKVELTYKNNGTAAAHFDDEVKAREWGKDRAFNDDMRDFKELKRIELFHDDNLIERIA